MRVLIADDDTFSRKLLTGTIKRLGHEVIECVDGLGALAALTQPDAPQLAILDWMMPGLSGLEVCRAVRNRPGPYTYVMLLTARDTHDDLLEALEAECDESLTKPFDPAELRLRVRIGERVIAMESRLRASHDALRHAVTHDLLTGLLSRGAVLEALEGELNRHRRGGPALSIMLADLDHFKAINDTYGHAVGDDVLRTVAERISGLLRSCDCVGRYGGEEFMVLAPGADPLGAHTLAERIRTVIAATPIPAGGRDVACTISIGVATSTGPAESAQGIVAAADASLYRAKRAGRNRVAA